MSLLSAYYPPRLEPTRHMRNGHVPNDGMYTRVIGALNHTLAYRKSEVYSREAELGNVALAPDNWRFRFRTGYGTRSVDFIAILGLSIEVGTSDPYINIALTEVGGSTTNLELHYGASATAGNGAPEDWSVQEGEIAVNPNTAYTCLVTISGAAANLSLTAREVGRTTVTETVDYYSEFEPTAGAPILDANIQKLIEGPSKMLRQNRALRAHWHLVDGAARTRSNSTPISLLDNTLTGTPGSTASGWRFVTTAHNTYGRTTVPVELACYAAIPSGSGTVRIRDTGGTDLTVTVNSATPQWFTATGTITVGTGQLYVPMYAGSGTQTISVYAVSLAEWEA